MLEVEGLSGDRLVYALESLLPRGASPTVALEGPAGGALGSGVTEAANQLAHALASEAVSAPGVSVNFNQQVIQHVAGSVVQNVQGTVNLSPEAKDLLELIANFGGTNRFGLESAVHELEDEGGRPPERIEARQKLKRFLADLGSRGLGVGLATLQKYVEHKIGLS